MPIEEFDVKNITKSTGRNGFGISAKIIELLSDLKGYSREEIAKALEIDTKDEGKNHSLTSNLSVLLHGKTKKGKKNKDGTVEKDTKTDKRIVKTNEKGVVYYWSMDKMTKKEEKS